MTNQNPDYAELVRFLIQPLLDSPDSLCVDCESANQNQRVWIRLAFEGEDKGRVFGRGGRNLQAIRTVLATAASLAGQSIHLDIYGSHESSSSRENGAGGKPNGRRRSPRRSSPPKPARRSRPQ